MVVVRWLGGWGEEKGVGVGATGPTSTARMQNMFGLKIGMKVQGGCTEIFLLLETCGWQLVTVAGPWVAHRVCAMPMKHPSTSSLGEKDEARQFHGRGRAFAGGRRTKCKRVGDRYSLRLSTSLERCLIGPTAFAITVLAWLSDTESPALS